MEKEFTCARCNMTFTQKWSDEEAIAEFGENFPEFEISDALVVCDDCYRELMDFFSKWQVI